MAPIIRRLLAHDAWTTRALLDVAADLPDADLDRPFEMGPGSLRATFHEIIDAMEGWADWIGDRPRRPRNPRGANDPIARMIERLDAAAADLRAAAEGVCAEGRLEEAMTITTRDGATYRFTRAIALVHVATHGMHHRAQAINILRHLGVKHDVEGDAISWEIAVEPASPDVARSAPAPPRAATR